MGFFLAGNGNGQVEQHRMVIGGVSVAVESSERAASLRQSGCRGMRRRQPPECGPNIISK